MDCAFMIFILSCFIGSASQTPNENRPPPVFSVTAVYTVTAPVHGQMIGQGSGERAQPQSQPQRQPNVGQKQAQSGEQLPPTNQIECQQPLTEEEEIEQQEAAARGLEKAVVGLEIAQGAIEITLGAIRIAAAGTTSEVLRREDAVAASKASASNRPLGFEGVAPLEPIRRDAIEEARKAACKAAQHPQADDPYSSWNNGYITRMKRSALFGPFVNEDMTTFAKPTPNPNHVDAYPVKFPNTDEAEHLLNLLENLLDTNNEVLRLLGIDLPPLTNQPTNPGAVLLRQYKQRLAHRRDFQRKYAETGYLDESSASQMLNENRAWRPNTISRRADVQTLTSELAQLNRMRRRFSIE